MNFVPKQADKSEVENLGGCAQATVQPRHSRRLSDKILIAFHHACDQDNLEVAHQLLQVLEMLLGRGSQTPDGISRRHNVERATVAAHERLWHLRWPAIDEPDACSVAASSRAASSSTCAAAGIGASASKPRPGSAG